MYYSVVIFCCIQIGRKDLKNGQNTQSERYQKNGQYTQSYEQMYAATYTPKHTHECRV